MSEKTLAIKYRPKTWEDVTEQDSTLIILKQQLETNQIKNCYLFTGPAGCGKTTCARIFANEINKGQGSPIEMDAASNSGVDDVRNISQQAKLKALDSEYKIFIIDECVTGDTEILTNTGWKRIDSITQLDKIAQYTKDGKIEFVDNWEYVKKEYSGDMYDVSFRNGKRHVLMSPHHVQPVRMSKSKEIKEQYIQDCKFAQSNEIIVAGKGTGNNESLSSLDRLFIACQADGYCNKSYEKCFWELSLSIPQKINRAIDLLDDCGIDYKVYHQTNRTNLRFYYDFPRTKKLQDYFDLNMGFDRAKDFISEILLWDGSTKSGYPGYYSCTDKDNVDFVSAVLSLCGCSGTVDVHKDTNSNHNDVWSINWYYQDYRTGQAVSKEVIHDWKGTIYCIKVPSQMIVLRTQGFTFISGNCHAISNTGWQAFLKLIEEPPAKSIFIFCTTDPQRIPKTILSRVQRYDFRRISEQGIVNRLKYILDEEKIPRLASKADTAGIEQYAKSEALEYIAKIAEGHLRDAISLMDKCLSFSTELTLENVVRALGTVDYDVMMQLTDAVITHDKKMIVRIVENIYSNGKDIKQFISQYVKFLLDVHKFSIGCSHYMQIPLTGENKDWLEGMEKEDFEVCMDLLDDIIKLNSSIKWSQSPKYDLEAVLLLFVSEDE